MWKSYCRGYLSSNCSILTLIQSEPPIDTQDHGIWWTGKHRQESVNIHKSVKHLRLLHFLVKLQGSTELALGLCLQL